MDGQRHRNPLARRGGVKILRQMTSSVHDVIAMAAAVLAARAAAAVVGTARVVAQGAWGVRTAVRRVATTVVKQQVRLGCSLWGF